MKNTIEDMVMDILDKNIEARNNDMVLMIKYMDKIGVHLEVWEETILLNAHKFETVRRIRQDIQSRWLYKPSNDTRIKRSLFEMQYRDKYRKKNEKTFDY